MVVTAPDEQSAERRLATLRTKYGLPDGCVLNDTFVQATKVGGLSLYMVGLVAAAPDGSSVTGAAADEHGFPVDRAFFELVERLSIFVARSRSDALPVCDARGNKRATRAASRVFPIDAHPESLRTSLSNGVALHASWPLACEAALCELVERDRVLRSFAGEYVPRSLALEDDTLARALAAEYALEAYELGPNRKKLARVAIGLFLFPRRPVLPLVYGFGAARDRAGALASARREALQRLAFLWGEELPSTPPTAAPTPDYHQEFYLYPAHHAHLRDWLAGGRMRARANAKAAPPFDLQPALFVDLSPPGVRGELAVAKALSSRARVLRFGVKQASKRARPPHPVA